MSKKNIKGCFCPKCGKKLFRRKTKRDKSTTCNYCGFVISNPYEVFTPKSKYLEMKK
jgi:DNA-directed RNA polymerase subunit RPC12/RpoP